MMHKLLVVFTLLMTVATANAQPYYQCGESDKYHLSRDCKGLSNCRSGILELDSVKAFKLKLCFYCDDLQLRNDTATSSFSKQRSISYTKSKSPHFYWLRYLLLGIFAGLFKVGKRWETIGAAIGLGVFLYWMNLYFHASTFKLNYSVIQSILFILGFGLSQTLISQIYKNHKADSFISAMMNVLSKSESELYESKKKNDTLEQQIRKLNLTQKQTEDALLQAQQIITQLKSLNPNTNSSKMVLVQNEKHRKLLIDALRKAQDRIVITSGWIRSSVINNEFKVLFKNCLDRNVDVFIYYGFRYGNKPNDSDKEALDFLEQMNAQYTNFIFRNHLENNTDGITGNHSKILVQDRRFMVLGSFNWLSNSGKLNKNLEMSMATNDVKTIHEVISRLRSS